jgi:hypothetical protein
MGTVVSVFCFLCEETIVITKTDCVHRVMRAEAENQLSSEHITKYSTTKWQHSV